MALFFQAYSFTFLARFFKNCKDGINILRISFCFDILPRFLPVFLPGFWQDFCQDLVSSLEPVPDNHCLPWLCNHVLPLFCLCWARSLLGWKYKNTILVKTYFKDCARWFAFLFILFFIWPSSLLQLSLPFNPLEWGLTWWEWLPLTYGVAFVWPDADRGRVALCVVESVE